MKPKLFSRAASVATMALLSIPAFAGPGAHGPDGQHLDQVAPAASSLARLPDGSVNVPKIAQRRMAIRTVVPGVEDVSAVLELPGRVLADPNATGRVQTVQGGRVEPGPVGLPIAGQRVARGAVLAYVRHHADPYAQGAQQALLADLRTQLRLAEQRVARLEGLEGTVPRKEIDAARAEAAGLAEREKSIAASIVSREALVAPVAGVVVRSDLTVGQVVESRDVLVEIIDPGRLLVEASTADAVLARRVTRARLRDVADSPLALIGSAASLREGRIPLTFAPPRGKTLPLAVGQPVTVLVETPDRIRGFVLPAEAIARNSANEPIVWIKGSAERYILQPVQYRAIDAERVVIVAGLGADNRVVVRGAGLLAQIR